MKQFIVSLWSGVVAILFIKLVDRDYDGDRTPVAVTLGVALLVGLLVAAYRRRKSGTGRWGAR
jgi:LPXTG-motif cell wall-anchored protein